ncbi:oligosaccharide flippase family protein [Acidovorax sp. NCPPB 2350]|nr:oligosaccharide flippase family protein [Acidovorax sp. NCPPB 2350]
MMRRLSQPQSSAPKLLSASSYILLTSVLGGVLGYVYSVVMGRMLGPMEYGLLGALMALVPILSVPMSTMNIAMARLFSRHLALNGRTGVASIFWGNQLWFLVLGLVGLVAFFLCLAPLKSFLKTQDWRPIAFIGINLFFMLLLPIANGLAQASHHFKFLAFLNVAGPLAKLLGSAALVALGWGVGGATLGLAAASAAMAGMSIIYCWKRLDAPFIAENLAKHVSFREVFPVLLAMLAFTLLFQIDVLLAKAFYDAEHAGYYAAAATLGKAVMYLPSAVVVPLLPMAAAGEALQQNTTHLLWKAIALTLVMTTAGALFYWIFAEQVIHLLFGSAFGESAGLLKWYGLAMVPVALIMVLEHYLIAQGKLLFAYLIFLATPLLVFASWYFSDHLIDLVRVMGLVASGILLMALVIWGFQSGVLMKGAESSKGDDDVA